MSGAGFDSKNPPSPETGLKEKEHFHVDQKEKIKIIGLFISCTLKY